MTPSTQIQSVGAAHRHENFSTYSAQRAAAGPPRAVADRTCRDGSLSRRRMTVPLTDPQVTGPVRTSTPGWATMHRVFRRCSSVGRAAVSQTGDRIRPDLGGDLRASRIWRVFGAGYFGGEQRQARLTAVDTGATPQRVSR